MTSPPPPITDPTITPTIMDILGCLEHEMSRVTSPPQVTALRPGDRIELLLSTNRDECCEGLAWVRVAGFYPSQDFPEQDTTYSPCPPTQWAVTIELGAARCAPTPNATELPTAAVWEATTRAVLDDAAACRRTIHRFQTLDIDRMSVPGQWSPMTTEGGCVGGTMHLTIAVPACDTVEDS